MEALHNAVKHIQAITVTVQLAATTADLTLTVTDDGCGLLRWPLPDQHVARA